MMGYPVIVRWFIFSVFKQDAESQITSIASPLEWLNLSVVSEGVFTSVLGHGSLSVPKSA